MPASTAAPITRRYGFTPRSTSSPAQYTAAPVPMALSPVPISPGGRRITRAPNATAQTIAGGFGGWPIVISPVSRLRNHQSTRRLSSQSPGRL